MDKGDAAYISLRHAFKDYENEEGHQSNHSTTPAAPRKPFFAECMCTEAICRRNLVAVLFDMLKQLRLFRIFSFNMVRAVIDDVRMTKLLLLLLRLLVREI